VRKAREVSATDRDSILQLQYPVRKLQLLDVHVIGNHERETLSDDVVLVERAVFELVVV
jgi:hypothetical protein